MFDQDISGKVICESLGVPRRTYNDWRRKDGWPTRGITPLPDALRTKALKMLTGGTPMAEVSRSLGVSRKTLSRWRRLQPVQTWRCPCVPFGVLVREATCPRCDSLPPWGKDTK
jgi:uncharacterized protein YjcR